MGELQGSIQTPLYGCFHIHYYSPLGWSMRLHIPSGEQKNITLRLLPNLFCESYQALLLDILWQELPNLIFSWVRNIFSNCRCTVFHSHWRAAFVAWGQAINRYLQLFFFLYVLLISFIKSSPGCFSYPLLRVTTCSLIGFPSDRCLSWLSRLPLFLCGACIC